MTMGVIAGGTGNLFLESADNFFADAVHAAHGGNDPDLVADAHLAVGAAEAFEGARFFAALRMTRVILRFTEGSYVVQGLVFIVQEAFQVGFDTFVVDHGAFGGVLGHMADGKAVLDDVLPCLEVLKDDLVAARDIDKKGYAFHYLTFGEVLESDGDVVGRVDFDVFH